MKRKHFCHTTAKTLISTGLLSATGHSLLAHENYKFNYIMCSAMYGTMKLEDILPEVKKIGASGIDLWPRVHADHREQAEKMGREAFQELLRKNKVKIKGMACYKLGPFGLQDEMKYAKEISGSGVTFVCASRGPKNLKPGPELKKAISVFCEKLKPHVEAAEKYGMTIAIEPMINMGTHKVKQLEDGWTIVTQDAKPSAHFEHNVAIVDGKPELLSTFDYVYEALGISSDEELPFRTQAEDKLKQA